MDIEIDVDQSWPAEHDWDGLAQSAAATLAQITRELGNPRLALSVLFTSDGEVRELNRRWRGKDRPTNVLSFPMLQRRELLALDLEGLPVLIGDIALAAQTCAREAAERHIPLAHHAAHLVVHGLLHLAGYDHETDRAEAAAMEALEIKALALLGIADPYGDEL